ncbi:hypothetical protein [Nitrospira sp. Ecomares 2.1]
MALKFKYALVEINSKPVLVDKKAFAEASQALRDALAKVSAITKEVKEKGFALQTPEGMIPVNLGSASDFSKWVTNKLEIKNFDLGKEVAELPSPARDVANILINTDLVLYSAALFYTGEPLKKLYGELVIGFKLPEDAMDFPLALKEIVIAVDNYPKDPKG